MNFNMCSWSENVKKAQLQVRDVNQWPSLCGRLYLLLLVCSCLKKQGATGSLGSQTEVKLFAAPQLCAQTCWDLQKGHRVSLFCVTAAAHRQTCCKVFTVYLIT